MYNNVEDGVIPDLLEAVRLIILGVGHFFTARTCVANLLCCSLPICKVLEVKREGVAHTYICGAALAHSRLGSHAFSLDKINVCFSV